jgi:RNA polymerase sigma factor (sigma-70 family)
MEERSKEILFASAFNFYFDVLYNYGMKIARNEDLVKDSIQDIFFRIWKNNVDFEKITYPKTYLLKALRRQILSALMLKINSSSHEAIDESVSIEFSPEDYLIQSQYEEEIRDYVVKALNKLPPKQKEAVYLRFFEEMEYEEIAEIMNINIQSVKNQVHRGLESLRGSMIMFIFMLVLQKIQPPEQLVN